MKPFSNLHYFADETGRYYATRRNSEIFEVLYLVEIGEFDDRHWGLLAKFELTLTLSQKSGVPETAQEVAENDVPLSVSQESEYPPAAKLEMEMRKQWSTSQKARARGRHHKKQLKHKQS